MQIVRFRASAKTCYGTLEGGTIVEYSGTPFAGFRRGRRRHPARQVLLLPPVLPTKIITIGLNYRERAAELGLPLPAEPLIVLKPATALAGPGDPILYPRQSRRVEYGAELAVVVKRRCRHVPAKRAREFILGYACLNDVTACDLAARDGQWVRGKGFDTFCPIGPCVATDVDPTELTVEAYVNGARQQAASTKGLVFAVEDILAEVSAVMTLMPGDVIGTGTPPGAGPLRPGDRVEVRIAGIGTLANTVVAL